METVDRAAKALLDILGIAAAALLAGLAVVEQWVRTQLAGLGVSAQLQTVIMLAVAVIIIVLVLRIFGGVIRVVLVLLLILLALHVLLPLVGG